MTRGCTYEVDAEYVTLADTNGNAHHLRQGDALPTWVKGDQLAALASAGAVTRYEVI